MAMSDAVPLPFGLLLRETRIRYGLTQDSLAWSVGVSHATISNWERGRPPRTKRAIPLLVEIFNNPELATSAQLLVEGDFARRASFSRWACEPSCGCKRHNYAGRGRNICSILECDRFVFGHGFCPKHYTRWRRWGDPHYVTPAPTTCPQGHPHDGLNQQGRKTCSVCQRAACKRSRDKRRQSCNRCGVRATSATHCKVCQRLKLSPAQEGAILRRMENGESQRVLKAEYGVSGGTIYRLLVRSGNEHLLRPKEKLASQQRSDTMTPEDDEELATTARAMGIKSRHEQGLPPTIVDPSFYHLVAKTITAGRERSERTPVDKT